MGTRTCRRRLRVSVAAAIAAATMTQSVFALDFFWDGDPATANAQYGAATQTWTPGAGNNWLPAVTSTANTVWVNAADSVARWGSGTTGTAPNPQTFNLGADITLNRMDVGGTYNAPVIIANSAGNTFALTFDGTAPSIAPNHGTNPLLIDVEVRGTVGITKGNNGRLIFNQPNTYTGGTTISTGVLQFNAANTIGGAGQDVNITATGAATFNYAGFQSTLGARIAPASAGSVALNASQAAENIDFSAAGANLATAFLGAVENLTYTGVFTPNGTTYRVGGGGATMTFGTANYFTGANALQVGGGAGGTVSITAPQNYTGITGISSNTLALSGGNDRLPTTTTLAFSGTSTLNVGANSQTLHTITVPDAAATNNTITGSGGTVIVNGAADLNLGPLNPTSTTHVQVNMSGLTNFTYNSPANIFRVGGRPGGTATSNTSQIATVTLGNTNNITASLLAVGDQGFNANPGNSTLNLGTTNVLNANTFNIGSSGRSGATLTFAGGLTNPTVTIRGTNGTDPVGSFLIGRISSNNATAWTDQVNVSAGTINALVTNMVIGNADTANSATRQGTTNASFTMGAGSMTVDTITLGRIANGTGTTTATFAANGTFTLNNAAGTLNAGTITLADNLITVTTGTARNVSGTFALVNGTLKATTIQAGSNAGTATAVTRAFNWTTGTVQNTDGANLAINDIPITLLTAAAHTFAVSGSNTTTVNSNSIISGATFGITKTGTGTLILGAANTYTGATTVSQGRVEIAAADRLADASTMSLGGGTFATGGFNETLGALGMTASSSIDMGTGASVLSYANSNGTWTGVLTIENWSGSTDGGGTDQLRFGTDGTGLSAAQLGQIQFAGFPLGAQIIAAGPNAGEVVPIPEPGAGILFALAATGLSRRRRR